MCMQYSSSTSSLAVGVYSQGYCHLSRNCQDASPFSDSTVYCQSYLQGISYEYKNGYCINFPLSELLLIIRTPIALWGVGGGIELHYNKSLSPVFARFCSTNFTVINKFAIMLGYVGDNHKPHTLLAEQAKSFNLLFFSSCFMFLLPFFPSLPPFSLLLFSLLFSPSSFLYASSTT